MGYDDLAWNGKWNVTQVPPCTTTAVNEKLQNLNLLRNKNNEQEELQDSFISPSSSSEKTNTEHWEKSRIMKCTLMNSPAIEKVHFEFLSSSHRAEIQLSMG